MRISSIQDGDETAYWGLGSDDVNTDVSPNIIMSCQDHNSTHRPTLGHHQLDEDRNRGTVLEFCPGCIILGSNLFCNMVDVRCPSAVHR